MNSRILDSPLESIEIHLNSEDSIYNFNKSHYHFRLKQNVMCSNKYVMRLSLKSATIPNSYYNINSTNNTLILKYDTTEHTIIIPVGNYNIQQLLQEFFTLFSNTVGANLINVEWLHKQNKVKITSTDNKILEFLKESSLITMLGFTRDINHSTTSLQNFLISDNQIDLRLNDVFYIQSNISSNVLSFHEQDKHHKTLAKIPITSQLFGVNIYQPINPNQVLIPSRSFGDITLIITDHKGNEIDFNNQLWSMTLEINFYKKVIQSKTVFDNLTGKYLNIETTANNALTSEILRERLIMEQTLINSDMYNIIFV